MFLKIFLEEIKNMEPYNFDLPDGKQIELKDLRIKCPEIIFNPEIIGKKCDSVPEAILKVILSFEDEEKRKKLFNKIYLSGKASQYEHLAERMENRLKEIAPKEYKEEIKVSAILYKEREIVNWIGGSILSQMPPFQSNFISKKEYEEYGENILDKKLFNY